MTLILVVAALPLLFVYGYCLYRSVLLGWISVLTLQLYTHTFGISPILLSPLHIDAVDIVELCLLGAGVFRTIPRLRERNTARRYVIVYLGVVAFSFVRGILAHGLPAAGNEARLFAGFLIACLYFLTAPVDPDSVRKYVRALLIFGLALIFVALLATLGLHVGVAAYYHDDPLLVGAGVDRVLPSDSALALAFCFYFCLAKSQHGKRSLLYAWLAAVFLGMAIYLRHRTVWVVLTAALIYIVIKDRASFRRLIPMGVVGCVVIAVYTLVAGSAAQAYGAKLSVSATDDQTWLWRLAGWQALIGDEPLTVFRVLFGKSLGSGYLRFDPINAEYIEYIPHSEYVMQFFNMGLAGLVALLCYMVRPLRRFWKLSSTDMHAVEPSASAWALVVLGIMVFSVSYDPTVEAYALLGIANALVFRLDKAAGQPAKSAGGRRKPRVYSRTGAASQEVADQRASETPPHAVPNPSTSV